MKVRGWTKIGNGDAMEALRSNRELRNNGEQQCNECHTVDRSATKKKKKKNLLTYLMFLRQSPSLLFCYSCAVFLFSTHEEFRTLCFVFVHVFFSLSGKDVYYS
jgi:hypothetical protein